MTWSASRRLIALLLAGVLGLTACQSPAPVPVQSAPATSSSVGQPPTVHVAQATRGSISSAIASSGSIQTKKQVTLLPKVSGRVTKMLVDVGSVVKAGDPVVEVEQDALAAQVAQAEAGQAAAEAKLAGLEAGGRDEVVAQAQANLKAAEARLAQLKAGPTPEQLAVAEAQVRVAKNQLFSVQTQADAYLGNPAVMRGLIIYTKDMKEAQSGVAFEQVQLAEANLAALKAGPTPEQLAQAQAAVDVARQQVAVAKSPAQSYDLKAARAGVDQAKAAADLARLQFQEAVVKAPFDGVVSQRLVAEGAMAAPTVPLLTVVSTETEVLINVEEARLGDVRSGQQAIVTTAAYPGEQFKASISNVAPTVDARTRMVQVRLAPDDPGGKLRDGMFAQVQIQTDGGKSEGLLVPGEAIVREDNASYVYVVDGSRVRRQSVTTGRSDGQRIAILSGLSEGDRVVSSGLSGIKDGDEVVIQ